jgi:sugar/nucleoside kinase (ribokinase family)
MATLDVVAVGELNPDLILDGLDGPPVLGREILASGCTFTLGSSTALCAANLAALGLRVGILGKVGQDLFGDFVLQALRDRRIDASRVIRDPTVRTGLTVSLASPQDRAMVTVAGAMRELRAEEVDLEYVAEARHLHISSLFLQEGLQAGCAGLFRAAKRRGLTTSLDPGWDPREEWDAGIGGIYPWLDILFVNEVEVAALARMAGWRRAALALASRVGFLVVKRGQAGAAVFQDGTERGHPGFAVRAVDPTGAGDAFDAGFLLGHLAGWPLEQCLEWGNACGALTASRPGGSGAFRSQDEVRAFLSAPHPFLLP